MKLKLLNLIYASQVPAVVNLCNMRLNLNESIQREMYLGTYEPEQSGWFRKYLRCGDVVLDIGANFGWYTTLSRSLVGANGHVFSFEPSPVANIVIESMIKDSCLRNVTLVKSAVGNQNGTIDLFMPTINNLHSPSGFRSDTQYLPIIVGMLKLDDFEPLQSIPGIRLIKIDVEGYEPDVLSGMENLINSGKIQYVMCEFNSYWLKMNKTTPEELHQKFMDYGFVVIEATKLKTDCKDLFGNDYSLQDKLYKYVGRLT